MNINDLYKREDEEAVWRIIELDYFTNRVAVIDIFSKKNCPKWVNLEKFDEMIHENELKIFIEPYPRFRDDSSLTEKETIKRDELMNCLAYGLEEYKNELLERESRPKIIRILAEKYNHSDSKVMRAFGKYWKRGMVSAALIPDFANIGKVKIVRRKNGRKRKYSETEGIIITDNIKRQMDEVIKKVYHTMKQRTLQKAYEELLNKYYHDSRNIDNYGKPSYDMNQIPSWDQFYHYFRTNVKKHTSDQARLGAIESESKNRALLSSSFSDANGPGKVYQLDATIADVVIVHSGTRQPIGKPTLIALIDVYSRLVVGLYVTLEHESSQTIGHAIINVLTDKVEFCERQGIKISKEEWPNSGLPQIILSDNGPVRAQLFDLFINKYNVEISHTTPYSGDRKGIIENLWRIFNLELRAELEGGGSWPLTRVNKDQSEYADCDINQFTQILTRKVKQHNTTRVSDLNQDRDMLNDGVLPIPCVIWEWGYQNHKGYINNVGNIDDLKLSLMQVGVAKITKAGILYKGIYFVSEAFINEKWHIYRINEKLKFRYDTRCLDVIYILNGNGFEKAWIADRSIQFRNLAEIEINMFRNNIAAVKQDLIMQKNAVTIDIDKEIGEIKRQAKRKKIQANNDSSIVTLTKSEARADEKNRQGISDFLTAGMTNEQDLSLRLIAESGPEPDDYNEDDFLDREIEKMANKKGRKKEYDK